MRLIILSYIECAGSLARLRRRNLRVVVCGSVRGFCCFTCSLGPCSFLSGHLGGYGRLRTVTGSSRADTDRSCMRYRLPAFVLRFSAGGASAPLVKLFWDFLSSSCSWRNRLACYALCPQLWRLSQLWNEGATNAERNPFNW
jgi:hypothetical protein